MKKLFFIAVGIILFFGVLGQTASDKKQSVELQKSGNYLNSVEVPNEYPTDIPTLTPTIYIEPTQESSTYSPPYNDTSSGLSNDNYYINSEGNTVHSPAYSDSVPAGATAQCNDGTYSFSQNRRGTCSHHGGVATWL